MDLKTAGEAKAPPAVFLFGLSRFSRTTICNQCGVVPIEPCEPVPDCAGVPVAPVAAGFFLPLVFGLCIEPPDMVLPLAGDAMLPPDIVPELAGVDGPDIDPPVWAKAAPARAVAASVMIAKAAARVVRVFMGRSPGVTGPSGSGGCGIGRHRPTSLASSALPHDRLQCRCHFPAGAARVTFTPVRAYL